MKVKKLFEGNSPGILYHYTTQKNLFYIIQDNILLSAYKNGYVSFTRSKHFINDNRILFNTKYHNVCIEVDREKLSKNYEIKAYNAFDPGVFRAELPQWDEQEEVVKSPIINFLRYVTFIYIKRIDEITASIFRKEAKKKNSDIQVIQL
jgi:hypothetical protein